MRKPELLDWLGRALALHWLEAPAPADAANAAADAANEVHPALVTALALPSAASLYALQQVIDLGYLRGVVNQLDDIEAREPHSAGFVTHLRGLARQFQFDAMTGVIRKANDAAA